MLRLRLLGTTAAYVGPTELQFAARLSLALLVYLAVERQMQHSRLALLLLFFPELSERQGRALLSKTLSRLRLALGEAADVLDVSRQTVGLAADAAIDVDYLTFLTLVTQAQNHSHEQIERCATCQATLAQAVALVRGDLLAGLDVKGSDGFDEWLLLERGRFEGLYLDALHALAAGALVRGEAVAAVAYARQQIAREAWRESAHRQLIEALLLKGDPGAALAQYETCRKLLQDELGVQPALATQALAARIRAGDRPTRDSAPQVVTTNNLPVAATPFFGRAEEIDTILARLRTSGYRLVTILGPGGIGKTRLAVEVGRRAVSEHLFSGVHFISLAGVTAADTLPVAIASALEIPLAGRVPAGQEVATALRERARRGPLLLIFDNFEQLSADPDWLGTLLAGSDQLYLIVTSRERLNLGVEDLFPLDGLPVPPPDSMVEEANAFAAVRMFVDRAYRLNKRFKLTADNWPDMQAISRFLAGLPLGIELAAHWVLDLSLDQIATTITVNPDFLATSQRDQPARQRSMRQVFDASWERLAPDEQTLLAQLAVMRGPFGVPAAQAVAAATPLTLQRLRYKSLLQVHSVGWYTIHELVRQFADERRSDTSAERRHAAYYLDMVAAEQARLSSSRARAAIDMLRVNRDNLRAAWGYALAARNFGLLGRAVEGFVTYLRLTGALQEGLALCQQALQALAAEPDTSEVAVARGRLAVQHAQLLGILKQDKAIAAAEQALTYAVAIDDVRLRALSHTILANIQYRKGQSANARDHVRRALTLTTTHDVIDIEVMAQELRGNIAYIDQDYATARAALDRAVALGTQHDTAYEWVASALGGLGNVASDQGRLGEAIRYHQQFLAGVRQVGDLRGEALALHWLSVTQEIVGQYAEIVANERRAAEILQRIGDHELESFARHGLTGGLQALGRLDEALNEAQRAVELSEISNTPLSRGYANLQRGIILYALGRLDAARAAFETAHDNFAAAGRDADCAECRVYLASIAVEQGAPARAAELLALFLRLYPVEDGGQFLSVIYLRAYRVLQALGERETAGAVLHYAGRQIRATADNMDDDALRTSYLNQVAANRELLHEDAASQSPGYKAAQ